MLFVFKQFMLKLQIQIEPDPWKKNYLSFLLNKADRHKSRAYIDNYNNNNHNSQQQQHLHRRFFFIRNQFFWPACSFL